MYRTLIPAAMVLGLSAPAFAEPVTYNLDPNHTEILFTWTHGGFSTTRGIFFGADGQFTFDEEAPETSSVSISVPTESMQINAGLKEHLASGDFFGENFANDITFASTAINVTGENTAEITGDLTVNGVTNEVVLDAMLNKTGDGPQGDPVAGFAATTTLLRSDYNLGAFAPFVSDEVEVQISVEGSPVEG
ncbi:YceI family protein [Maribius pontilimi]|uniref:YceI family protein n=1 Tax=Palleronia pontilimi TaxID=1964209 RepID=A0A934MBP1_9RHOB|nr:YceI family protein [Palleronia pontilimi]MBJ3761913.1 YceI family protein [Palleronia pontilimi]